MVLGEIAKSLGRPPAGISREARDQLLAYDWPGNVRELRNTLERAAILCEGGLVTAEDLTFSAPVEPLAPAGAMAVHIPMRVSTAIETTDLRIWNAPRFSARWRRLATTSTRRPAHSA